MVNLNYSKKLEEIQKLIGHWSRRLLSPLGKITVIKSILLPKLTHLFIALPNPTDNMINNLEGEFFQFLWSKNPDKISRKLAIQNYSNGGLNMIPVHGKSFIKSMKITWTKILLTGNSKWIEVFEKCLNVERELFFTYKEKWIGNLHMNIDKKDWKCINSLMFNISQDTYIRWFQYRIIHRNIETNVMLFRYNIVNSELCTFCGQSAETIFHLFIECMHVDSFWKELRLWFLQVAYIDITLDPFDICLIKEGPKNQAMLNLIITLAKRHIYNQKLSKKITRVDVFLLELKKILLYREIYICN